MGEWQELKTITDVAAAQAVGMEIEVYVGCVWEPWLGKGWINVAKYRARPRKPAKVLVKSLCWRGKGTGHLVWWDALANPGKGFVRFPAGDLTGEVEE